MGSKSRVGAWEVSELLFQSSKMARWYAMQKIYSRFKLSGVTITNCRMFIMNVLDWGPQ